jgi:hypothetical protein
MCRAEYRVTDQQQTVMRRKTQAGRALHQSRTVSVLKALRLTMSKVGNDLFSLPVAILGATQTVLENEDCAEVFQDDHLLILLDGSDGLRGAVMVDPVLVGGLIQQQTMGAVYPVKDPSGRPMTATDASLVEPLINALLSRAADLPETEAERSLLVGFKFGAKAKDSRLLMLALDAREFHILRLTVDMAKGVRRGELLFCLPVPPPRPVAEAADSQSGSEVLPASPKTLCASVLSLKADLMVSLTQFQLPIRVAGALRVGQVLDLGHVSFEDAQVRTRQGRILARGVLGQQDGMRALRLKHREKKRETLQRRTSDVEDLQAERAQDAQFDDFYSVQDLPALPELAQNNPPKMDHDELGQPVESRSMPDMSDLPGFDDDDEEPMRQYQAG